MTKDKLEKWNKLSAKLKEVKEEEMALRIEIINELRPNTKGTKGIKHIQSCGYIVDITHKLKKNIDGDQLYEDWDGLSQQEQDCIKWKPEIIAANLSTLEEENILFDYITEEPALSGLKITKV